MQFASEAFVLIKDDFDRRLPDVVGGQGLKGQGDTQGTEGRPQLRYAATSEGEHQLLSRPHIEFLKRPTKKLYLVIDSARPSKKLEAAARAHFPPCAVAAVDVVESGGPVSQRISQFGEKRQSRGETDSYVTSTASSVKTESPSFPSFDLKKSVVTKVK